MAPIAASSILFFSFLQALLFFSTSLLANADHHLNRFAFLLRIVLTSTLLVLLLLYNATAGTMLYMYCKAVHGELVADIVDEFACQYVSLPLAVGCHSSGVTPGSDNSLTVIGIISNAGVVIERNEAVRKPNSGSPRWRGRTK
ncbi:uncharacterized protein LOC109791247 [Cajanus cajan]|nr:uncharacterized protein LOC109791247 [Cajanus cajan]